MLQNPQRGRLAAELEDLATIATELATSVAPATIEAVRQAPVWRDRAVDALGRRDLDAGWHFATSDVTRSSCWPRARRS